MHGGKREGAGRKPGSASKLDAEARQKAKESGIMPLDYLLSVMRDETQDDAVRRDAAKAAAPYCHARLASTEISGPERGPIRMSRIFDISDLNVQELDIFERVLEKTRNAGEHQAG